MPAMPGLIQDAPNGWNSRDADAQKEKSPTYYGVPTAVSFSSLALAGVVRSSRPCCLHPRLETCSRFPSVSAFEVGSGCGQIHLHAYIHTYTCPSPSNLYDPCALPPHASDSVFAGRLMSLCANRTDGDVMPAVLTTLV